MNWLRFDYLGEVEDEEDETTFDFTLQTVHVYPNPTVNNVNIAFGLFFRQDLAEYLR